VEPETVKDAELVLLRPAVAARRIGVAVCTLASWHRAGKITAHVTKGGQRRYPESEIRPFEAVA
jgi:predicted site-specific integrase-resolvase